MTDKEIELIQRIQKLEGRIQTLKDYVSADAKSILMYLERDEPNIGGAIRKANIIVEVMKGE